MLLGGLYLWIKKRKSDDDGYSLPELGESYAKKPPISPKPFAVEPPVYPDSSTASSATFADRAQSQSPYPTAYAADVPYNPNPMIAGTGTIPTGTELVVVMPFVPTQDDELVLNRGDRIVVDTVFEDGWAVGCVSSLLIRWNELIRLLRPQRKHDDQSNRPFPIGSDHQIERVGVKYSLTMYCTFARVWD